MAGNPKQLLDEATAMLSEYHKMMKRDQDVPDMKEFEKIIKQLCDSVTTLPKKEADVYKKALLELGVNLDKLAKNLEEKRDVIKAQIENSEYNKKAQVAYRVADHLAKDKK